MFRSSWHYKEKRRIGPAGNKCSNETSVPGQTSTKERLSLNKLLLEGTPSKIMIVLEWLIDTRRLLLRLPQDKFGH